MRDMEETIKICDLSDDLLLRILILVPAKDAVATAILSKRWRYIWQLLPHLTFEDEDDQDSESFGWFVDKTMQQLHKAPSLICLDVELGPLCPVDVDVTKWVDKAVNHSVRFRSPLDRRAHKLISLTLSNQTLVDVSFPDASLPSLLYLKLVKVVYKDEVSLARLFSSSPVLRELDVQRRDEDESLTNFTVKVPSLKEFTYGRLRWGTYRPYGGGFRWEGGEYALP
ncbi:PREDICTED: putative F-box/FBD/LRR-repeat protein At1g22000 [Camelina sativa]|uniref:F-box/FBD/LRR-repeat protein At1g22000 n=1 Tax=Camelina sativa TaxID=90675 RepID=A0ABM0YKQ5_CAMSA|nr:PREDICTED: putative F-box/FBD/LRR-repeat protein At1g22000 [Camelina sativa]